MCSGPRRRAIPHLRSGVALDDVLARDDRAAAAGRIATPPRCRSSSSPRAPRRRPRRSCTPSRRRTSACGSPHDDLGDHRRRRGVDAVADRPLDRLQLRRALRALPRAARSCCRTAGTPTAPSTSSPSSGARTRWPRRRSCRTSSEESRAAGARLDSLRCFGCGGAPVPPGAGRARREAHGVQVLRLYGSTEVLVGDLEPARLARSSDATPTGRHEPRRAGGPRRRRRATVAPGRPARSSTRGPEHVRRLLRRSRAHRARRSTPTAGCAPVTSSRSTTTATSPSSGARRRSSSAAA